MDVGLAVGVGRPSSVEHCVDTARLVGIGAVVAAADVSTTNRLFMWLAGHAVANVVGSSCKLRNASHDAGMRASGDDVTHLGGAAGGGGGGWERSICATAGHAAAMLAKQLHVYASVGQLAAWCAIAKTLAARKAAPTDLRMDWKHGKRVATASTSSLSTPQLLVGAGRSKNVSSTLTEDAIFAKALCRAHVVTLLAGASAAKHTGSSTLGGDGGGGGCGQSHASDGEEVSSEEEEDEEELARTKTPREHCEINSCMHARAGRRRATPALSVVSDPPANPRGWHGSSWGQSEVGWRMPSATLPWERRHRARRWGVRGAPPGGHPQTAHLEALVKLQWLDGAVRQVRDALHRGVPHGRLYVLVARVGVYARRHGGRVVAGVAVCALLASAA
jgi:hypothetical protein